MKFYMGVEKKMYDIHCHLLFDVDDGPASIKDSKKILEKAGQYGIKGIVCTVHHNKIYKIKSIEEYNRKIESLKEMINSDIKLALGFEFFLREDITEVIKSRKQSFCLNRSQYFLLEVPFKGLPNYYEDVIKKLQLCNIIPVIAHPERCRYFIYNMDKLLKLIESGCLIQVDASSIVGIYGNRIRDFVKKMAKLRLIHFVASNAHYAEDYDRYYNSYEQFLRWTGERYTNKVFHENCSKIFINDRDNAKELIG